MASAGLVFAWLLLGAQFAFGHAVLLESSPSVEAVLDIAPTEIRLGFNENVGPIFVKILDASGTESGAPGDYRVEGNNVYLPLNESLVNGTYVVVYRVISADTHPVGGSVLFAVGEPIADVSSVADAGSASSGWRTPVAINRFLIYAAGALSAGSALLLVVLSFPSSVATVVRAQGRLSALLTAIVLPLAIGLGGAEMQAGTAAALFSTRAWATGLGSTLGSSAMIGVPGALLLWRAMRNDNPGVGWLLAGAALVIGSFLVTGHAATAAPAWLMAFVVGVHLVAVAFWFAALLPLRHAVNHLSASDAGSLLDQFSARGVVAVACLAVSGAIVSYVQVQDVTALWTTDYGFRLLVKLALVAVVVALAVLNKQRLTGRLRAEATGATAALSRTIRAEYILILVIMAVAVSLTLPSPPRALLAASAAGASAMSEGFSTNVSKDGINANVAVTPARTGENMVMLMFTDDAGNAVAMQRVRISLALPAAALDGVEHEGEAMAAGAYHFMLNDLIIPGEWEIRIDAFVDDFDKKILRVKVPVK